MSSQVSRKQLAEAVVALASKSTDAKDLARSIAAYLIDEGRLGEIDSLIRELEFTVNRQTGQLEVHATSAHELTDSVRKAIEGLFMAKHITLHEEIDPGIIGGVRVRAHDQVLDLSVRTRLRQLKGSIKV